MSCQKAIGVAKAMKEKFDDRINLNIYTNDSEEAKGYTILSSTNVYVNDQLVSPEIALDKKRMLEYLALVSCIFFKNYFFRLIFFNDIFLICHFRFGRG